MDDFICSALVGPPVGQSRPQLWVSRCTVWVIRQDHLVAWCPQTTQGWWWFLDKSTRLDGEKLYSLFLFFNTLAKISTKHTVCGQSLEPKSCFKKEMKSWWSVSLIPSKWLQARMTTSFGWAASQRAMLCIVSWRGGAPAMKKTPQRRNLMWNFITEKNRAHHNCQMCVYHVCKVQFAGRVIRFGRDAEVKVSNPHWKLIIDFSFLPEEQWRKKHNQKMWHFCIQFNPHAIIIISINIYIYIIYFINKNPVDHSEKLHIANLIIEFVLEAESKAHNCWLAWAASAGPFNQFAIYFLSINSQVLFLSIKWWMDV